MKTKLKADTIEVEQEGIPAQKPRQLSSSQKDIGTMQTTPTEAGPVSAADNWIGILLANNRPMEDIQKFIDMRNQEIARLAKLEFDNAKSIFLEQCPPITKNKSVHYHTPGKAPVDYEYSELAHVIGLVKGSEGLAGLSHDWATDYEGEYIWITCILSHRGGHSKSDRMRGKSDTTGGKQGIQADGSTISYLKRYTLLNVLGLAAGGDDDDGQKGRQVESVNQESFKRTPTPQEMNAIITALMQGVTTLEQLQETCLFTEAQMEAINSVPKPGK